MHEKRRDRNILVELFGLHEEHNLARLLDELRRRLELLERKLDSLAERVYAYEQFFRELEKVMRMRPCPYRMFVLLPDRQGSELVIRVRAFCTMDNSLCECADPRECPRLRRS